MSFIDLFNPKSNGLDLYPGNADNKEDKGFPKLWLVGQNQFFRKHLGFEGFAGGNISCLQNLP